MLALVLTFSLIPVDSRVYAERHATSAENTLAESDTPTEESTDSEVPGRTGTSVEVVEEDQKSDSLPTVDQAEETSPETANATTSEAEKEAEVVSESSADPKSQTTSDELMTSEDGEESTPLPVGGGSSGGGGGSSGGGGSRSFARGFYTRPTFDILKFSTAAQKQPMKVAFLITNLQTNESHIVVTDDEGKVNGLSLAETYDLDIPMQGGSLNPRSDYYLDEEKTRPDLYGRPDGAPPAPDENPFFPGGDPIVPLDSGEVKSNQNDEFKDKINSNKPLKYKAFHKGDRVVFKEKHKTKKLTLTLKIQLSRWESGGETVIKEYDFTYPDVDGAKFDKYVFIKEVEDFISGKAEQINKTVTDYNKRIKNCSYSIKLVDPDRPKYKVEELRTDTNLNHNLRTFYLQPGDIKRGKGGPWNFIQEVWIGDKEDQLTKQLKSTADQNEAAIAAKRKPIVDELEKIEEKIKELKNNQEKDYVVRQKDGKATPSGYTVTVKKLIDAKRTDPKSLINEFGELLYAGGGPTMLSLEVKTGDYDTKQTFDKLEDAQKYVNSFKFPPDCNIEIFPGNSDVSFITDDNILVRVYPQKEANVLEMPLGPAGPSNAPKIVKTFDNTFDACSYMDEMNKLPDDYYSMMLKGYELEKERRALEGGYELDLPTPPKGLDKALEEYDKNKDELLYKQRGYYLKEDAYVVGKPEYTGPYTLLIYDKTQDLLNLKINGGIGGTRSPLEKWISNQSSVKQILEKANLGLTPTEKTFQNREELEKWFEENDMANLDVRLRMVNANVRSILMNASPMNSTLRTTVENEKFEFHTVATDESGTGKTVEKSTKTVIQDKITYDKFNIGSIYKFAGRLVHKRAGEEVETLTTFEHVTEALTERTSGEDGIVINITFDSSKFQAGDEFVLLYDIYENGNLVGKEDDINNADQTVSLKEEPQTRDIKVTKLWNQGSEKPVDKIEVELYRDGKPTGKKLELNESNKWTGEFKGLEIASKEAPTVEYQYSAKEVGELNGSIQFGSKKFEVSYSGDVNEGFIITNKEKPEKPPETPPETPNTYDPGIGLYLALLGISALGLCAASKKKEDF